MEKGGSQEKTEIEMTGRKEGQREKRLEGWRDAKKKKCVWILGIEFLLLVWFLIGDCGLFGFFQSVAAFILLFHPIYK